MYFWGHCQRKRPPRGAGTPPNTGSEPVVIARELARRGLDAFSLDATG